LKILIFSAFDVDGMGKRRKGEGYLVSKNSHFSSWGKLIF
jgi:hypothetical protein